MDDATEKAAVDMFNEAQLFEAKGLYGTAGGIYMAMATKFSNEKTVYNIALQGYKRCADHVHGPSVKFASPSHG